MRMVFWHPKRQTTSWFNRLTVSGSLNDRPVRNRGRWIFIWRIIQRKIGTIFWFRETGNFRDLELRFIPNTEDDLENTLHDYQHLKRDFINLNIDLNIHGVGGDDTWGSKTMEKYTNSGNKTYNFGFTMEYIVRK